jgi:transglutaminase-like putative cysteine protease
MPSSRLAEIDNDLPADPDVPDSPRPPTRRLLWLEITLVGLACWVAAAAFRPVFAAARTFSAPTVAAIVLATVIARLAARRNIAARWSLVGSAVVAALFVSYTILVGSLAGGVVPGPDTLSGLREGIGHGFSSMLGDALPLANHTLALVFVTFVSWLGATAATELTQRTSIPALPLLAPLAIFGLAMPVVAPNHPPSLWHIGAFIALCLLVVLVRAVPDPRATGTVIGPRVDGLAEFHSRSLLSSRLALGLPLIALCAVIAPLVGDATATRDPFDPRDLREQRVEPIRVEDPLGEYKRIVGQSPPQSAFRVTSDGVSITDIARVAVVRLDTYDGVRFTTSDRYQVAGPLLTSPDQRPSSGRDTTLKFSDLDLDDPWLPTGGTPTRIDLRGVGFDAASGDLLAPGSVKGLEYELRARIVTPTPAELAAAPLDTNADADLYRALPGGLPPNIGRIANEVTAGATTPGEALQKLATFLQTEFTLDPTAPAGHAAGRLEQFLRADRAGSAEQFATAFTVMARSLGFPARVVVGYKLIANDNGSPRPLEYVYSNSYHVWSEVKFATLGWVAYDPTPSAGTTPPQRPTDTASSPATVTPQASGQQSTPKELGPSEADPATNTSSSWWDPFVTVAFVVGAVLALVLAVCGAIIGVKGFRRRKRRGEGRAADRVVGAWDEVVDRLIELQFPITQSMTPRDIARATQATYGTAATLPLSFLVPDVGRAVFSGIEPDAETVDRSWLRAHEFEQNLAITLSRSQRWRARLSLRPLRNRPAET